MSGTYCQCLNILKHLLREAPQLLRFPLTRYNHKAAVSKLHILDSIGGGTTFKFAFFSTNECHEPHNSCILQIFSTISLVNLLCLVSQMATEPARPILEPRCVFPPDTNLPFSFPSTVTCGLHLSNILYISSNDFYSVLCPAHTLDGATGAVPVL